MTTTREISGRGLAVLDYIDYVDVAYGPLWSNPVTYPLALYAMLMRSRPVSRHIIRVGDTFAAAIRMAMGK
jgi:hypothetical protein